MAKKIMKDYTLGTIVQCNFDKKICTGIIKEIHPDHIIISVPEISDHCWYEDGLNMDTVADVQSEEEFSEEFKRYIREAYTIEPCPWCGREQVIRTDDVTRCQCGKPLAPCTACDCCNYNTCPFGCTGGDKDDEKPSQYEAIPEENQAKLYKLL